jgi:glycosyltransferase involved in cell wall biosynthesis
VAGGGLTIFFPAYNDAFTIASLVVRAVQAASSVTDDYEIVVVNDGSTDATRSVLEDLARRYECLRLVHHPVNRGYGAALRSGFEAARKPLVFYTDGDAQYDPAELTVLWPRMEPGVDLVNGYKISRSDPMHRVIIGRLYHHMVKQLFGLRLRDVDCDFRLMRRAIFERVHLEEASGVICLEMMKKIQDAGFGIVEAPVHHYHRASGRSQFFNFRRVFKTLLDVRRLWWTLVIHPAAGRGAAAATPAVIEAQAGTESQG